MSQDHARPTLADVARAANTSPAAASRALNGRSGVNSDARARVLDAARQLGYSANFAARSLANGRSSLVGIVVSDKEKIINTQVFSGFLDGAISLLQRFGHHAVVMLPEDETTRRVIPEEIKTAHLDGAIIIGHRADDPLLASLVRARVPLVCFGRPLGYPGLWYVDVDNNMGADMAIRHLVEQGRRRIGVLASGQDRSWGLDRLQGARTALEKAGLESGAHMIEVSDFTAHSGAAAMSRLLDRVPDLDGLFATTDAAARGAMHLLAERGRRIPDETAVVAYADGPADFEFVSPKVTAVQMPLVEMGEEAARLVLSQIEETQVTPRRSILNLELSVHESSREADSAFA